VTLRPLPLLSLARELQRTGGVMLDARGQRPDIFVNVVISIASTGALEQHYTNNAFDAKTSEVRWEVKPPLQASIPQEHFYQKLKFY